MHDINYDKELDTSDLLCPWPLVRAKQMLAHLASGQILRVSLNRSQFSFGFQSFCCKNTTYTLT